MMPGSAAAVFRSCLDRLAGVHGLGQAPTLVNIIEVALAVPAPPGQPDTIRTAAATLRRVGGGWESATSDLGSVAQRGLPVAWSGASAELAQAEVHALATTMGDVPEACQTVSDRLEEWATVVELAQLGDASDRAWLLDARDKLRAIGAGSDSWGANELWQQVTGEDDENNQRVREWARYTTAVIGGWADMAGQLQEVGDALSARMTSLTVAGVRGIRASAGNALQGLGAALPTDPAASAAGVEAARDARTVANSRNWNAGDTAALARLEDLLHQYRGDPAFQLALMKSLGPAGLLSLGNTLANIDQIDTARGDSAVRARATAAREGLAAALATATNKSQAGYLGEDWIKALKARGRAFTILKTGKDGTASSDGPAGTYGYEPLSVLLGQPGVTFSTGFLVDVGTDMLSANIQPHPHLFSDIKDPQLSVDPMNGLMTAMGNNKQAATLFFDPQRTNVDGQPVNAIFALATRDWNGFATPAGDGQAAFAHAIDRSVSDPGSLTDRRIMSTVVDVFAAESDKGIPAGMQRGLTDAVRTYITSGAVDASYSGVPQTSEFVGATPGLLNSEHMKTVLAALAQDPQQYDHLLAAELAYGQSEMLRADGLDHVNDAIYGMGNTIGALTTGQMQGIYYQHAAADAQHNLMVDRISSAANLGIGRIELAGPVGGLTTDAVQDVAGRFEDSFRQDSMPMAQKEAGGANTNTMMATRYFIQQTMLAHLHFTNDDIESAVRYFNSQFTVGQIGTTNAQGIISTGASG